MSVSVKVTMEGFDEWVTALGKSPQVEAILDVIAEEVASEAKRTAPYSNITKPGHRHYRDSIHVETVEAKHRKVKRVVADVPHAFVVEARTGNLSRALKQVRNWK